MFPHINEELDDPYNDILRSTIRRIIKHCETNPTLPPMNISIEDQVIQEIQRRKAEGFAKYGTTMERNDLTLHDWLQHLKEELLDASIYIQKLQHINSELIRATTQRL